MNISLAKKKRKKAKVAFGLNKRGLRNNNVFDESDGESGGDDESYEAGSGKQMSEREIVNRKIAREQAMYRQRIATEKATKENSSMYDYDGEYDNFKIQTGEKSVQKEGERKSRYVEDLLKAAKKRNQEKEIIHERKVAREQAEEDGKEEYNGKEKFITKAYKQRLEERKRFESEDEKLKLVEEKNEVTRKTAGAAFATFYGNLGRNVAMGGADTTKKTMENNEEKPGSTSKSILFLDGFERSGNISLGTKSPVSPRTEHIGPKDKACQIEEKIQISVRLKRSRKVSSARERYFARKRSVPQ